MGITTKNCLRGDARRALAAAVRGLGLLSLVGGVVVTACVQAQPPTDTGSPTSPSSSTSGPSSPTSTGPLAYTPDLKPVFDSDCVPCHSNSRPSAGYSMSTYAQVMRDVIPGNPASRLVVTTQPGGSMYPFFSSNPAGRAAMVRSWVVDDNAVQSR